MKLSPIIVVTLLVAMSPVTGPARADPQAAMGRIAEDAIKPGSWEFTSQLQFGAAALRPPNSNQSADGQQHSVDGLAANYRMCVDARRAIPSDLGPNCKLEEHVVRGTQFTWSTVCTNAQSSVHSVGTAQYHGDTMTATLVNQVPGGDGRVADVMQRITGRYVGPCTQQAEADASATPESIGPSAAPPAAGLAATGENAPAARNPYDPHYVPQAHHYRRHYRYYAGPPNILALPFIGLRGLLGR